MRCVLPHTQRCHESKARTSPATALYFSSKQTATATAGCWRASVKQVDTGGEGRRRGRAVVHILPPLSVARLCDTAGRRSPYNTSGGRREEQSPHRNMLGTKRVKGHALLPPAPLPSLPSLIFPPLLSSLAGVPGDARLWRAIAERFLFRDASPGPLLLRLCLRSVCGVALAEAPSFVLTSPVVVV